MSSKLFCVLSKFSPKSKRVKFPKVNAKIQTKRWKKCLRVPFIGSDLFILTSMVMSSIIMEVIHMYVSIAMKLTYWTFSKVNVNSTMCDFPALQVIKVQEEFTVKHSHGARMNSDRCVWCLVGCGWHSDRYKSTTLWCVKLVKE